MQITGGVIRVARVLKPGDYESKTADVSLSFNIHEGDDYQVCLDQVGDAAHKHAMALAYRPDHAKQEVVEVKTEKQPNPHPGLAEATVALAARADHALTSVGEVTDAELLKAIQGATARSKDPDGTRNIIWQFTDKPGMTFSSVPQEKRSAMLVALKAVPHASAADPAAAY